MQLSEDQITKLQVIYRELYGLELSHDEACEQGRKILQVMTPLLRKAAETTKKEV
jgi:hypothetical protein